MLKDLHTEEGQRALAIGEACERRLWKMFSESDADARWISGVEGDWLAGHDFIFKGKRVEVKSNEGASPSGFLYDTCCLELETRGGNTIGWSQGKADAVLLVNRAQSMGFLFHAAKLKEWSRHQPFFWKHEAKCTKLQWDQKDAGYVDCFSL
jgi:hypothetical protein